MRFRSRALLLVLGVYAALLALHAPLLRLPYYWDEAGYYIPAALDFFYRGLLIPESTLTTGHPPLVAVYLGTLWHVFGFSPLVTRGAMILTAAAAVVATYALGRCVAKREVAAWSAVLLALSPLFFAQSSLAHLDVTAALWTTLAVVALLRRQMPGFAAASSLAILSKETAVVLLPVAWALGWRRRKELTPTAWWWLLAPILALAAWAVYYHQSTGFWTGNREYLQYNLYSTLNPIRILLTLVRRLYELFIGGFNWVLVVGAAAGAWKTEGSRQKAVSSKQKAVGSKQKAVGSKQKAVGSKQKAVGSKQKAVGSGLPIVNRQSSIVNSSGQNQKTEGSRQKAEGSGLPIVNRQSSIVNSDFILVAVGLVAVYVLMLSVVGGAVLPRYLLPALPIFYLALAVLIWRLPKPWARGILTLAAACLVGSWFINPPGPFPYEDNLAYADFIRLHQQASVFLEKQPGQPRILTAWPASDELTSPSLGYVAKPLDVVPLASFEADDLAPVQADSFDLLYLYSRKWEPPDNWLNRYAWLRRMGKHYFDYSTQVPDAVLVDRFHLRLLTQFERSGQWVRIYTRLITVAGGQLQ
jgi:4-amino-4-deoxy-L-arabinose transferase-like glycosyltransferase